MNTLTSQDAYQVYCKGYLSEDKIRVLTHLYQPICRYDAFSLYMTLYYEVERGRMLNAEATHYRLSNITQMHSKQIQDALHVLEAIGLVRTYKAIKQDKTNYIYELLLPLTPKRFFSHEVLNTLLYRVLGEVDYERTKYFFKIPSIDTVDYENVTHHFDEVFHIDLTSPNIINTNQTFEEDTRNEPVVSYDLSLFYQGLEDYRIPTTAITKEIENAIVSLGVVYHISPIEMRKLVYDVYEHGKVELTSLQERCLRYYEFENQTQLKEVLASKEVQPKVTPKTKREEKIEQLKTLSPYQYLQALQKGGAPTSRDLNLIEKLMTEQKLTSGVVNVIVETVLLLNNGQLPKNHLEYIAGMFARKNITTVEAAMEEAKTYIASRKNQQKTETKVEEPQERTIINQEKVSNEQYNDLMEEIQKLLKGAN